MNAIPLDESLAASLDIVRRLDHDRYLTALLAPADRRAALTALYAFNAEIARIRETVSEPMLGQIRLQWWREAIEAIPRGDVHGHEAIVALAGTWTADEFPTAKFTALIDARERDLDDEPFANLAALEAYSEATSSNVMALASLTLAGEAATATRETIRLAGIAYALTGLLRAMPVHASHGRLYLPLDLLGQYNVDPHQIFAGEMSDGLRSVMNEVATRARALLGEARKTGEPVSRRILPALLPASFCDRYLDIVMAPDFNPFQDRTEVPAFKLQLRLMGRKLAGRF